MSTWGQIAFVALFLLSLASLLQSVVFLLNPEQSRGYPKKRPSIFFLAVFSIVASVLASESTFDYRLLALVYLLATLMIDFVYADERWRRANIQRSRPYERVMNVVAEPISKWRLRWGLLDNCAWTALVLLLYLA